VQHELGNVNELPKYIYIKLSSGWQNVSFGLILGLLALLLGWTTFSVVDRVVCKSYSLQSCTGCSAV